jgi:hypothetical protein
VGVGVAGQHRASECGRGNRRAAEVSSAKKSSFGTISSRARGIADDLDLPGNPAMVEFLSGAEILLEADGNDPEQTYELMVQAGWEYATLVVEAGARRQIQ